MRDAGLQPDLCLEGGFEYEAGYNAALRMRAAGPLPDAVVDVNDEVAIGVLTGLRQAGVEVPAQVSIAGIDDTRPARFVELTTVNVPLYGSARSPRARSSPGAARRTRRRPTSSSPIGSSRAAPPRAARAELTPSRRSARASAPRARCRAGATGRG
jgi:LacI family transcriptional regulator